jgi:hypothetical protein
MTQADQPLNTLHFAYLKFMELPFNTNGNHEHDIDDIVQISSKKISA